MDPLPFSWKPPVTVEAGVASSAPISDLLPPLIPLDFIVVADLGLNTQFVHGLPPVSAVPCAFPPVPGNGQEVSVFVLKSDLHSGLVCEDKFAEHDEPFLVVGESGRDAQVPPLKGGCVAQGMGRAELVEQGPGLLIKERIRMHGRNRKDVPSDWRVVR